MPKGGDLSLVAIKKQDVIVFSVGDTGVGIPEDVKPKLFTPMMTTKAKGQGSAVELSPAFPFSYPKIVTIRFDSCQVIACFPHYYDRLNFNI